MAEKFKAGDMVKHKTGGPKMLVTGYTYGMVKCWWPGKTHHGQDFMEETLEPEDEPKTAPENKRGLHEGECPSTVIVVAPFPPDLDHKVTSPAALPSLRPIDPSAPSPPECRPS
jgi:uncharacterized protein YodC (DUF2158 family)